VYIKNASGTQLKKYTYESGDLSTSEPDDANVTIDLTAAELAGAKTIEIDGSGTLYKYISDLKVSQKAYLTASTSSVTMSTVKACGTAEGQFTISYSDLSRLQLSQTNENFTYEVWDGETKLDGFNNDCGDYGTYTIKFFYTPQSRGDYSNTVTISASGLSQEVTLSGTASKPDRTIVWGVELSNTIEATRSLDLTAYAETSCESPAGGVYYTYTSATDGAATIDGNNITFNKAATVTVTAHSVNSDNYNDAESVSKVWVVGKVGVQMRTLPTITSTITYGDNSSVVSWDNDWVAEDNLENEEVAGSIAYVGPANFTAAGATNLTFNFTPNDVTAYEVLQFTVPVTVQKADPEATPSAANIVYGNAVNSAELSNTGTEGTWTWKDESANEAILNVGTHSGLNVHFTPSDEDNYNGLDATVSLTIDPATPNLEWSVAPSSFSKAATGIVFTAASDNSEGAVTYSITSGTSYASIHATTGALTINDEGTITVQASIAANGNYSAYSITTTATISGAKIYSGEGGWETSSNWSTEPGETPDVVISTSAVLTIDEEVTVASLTIENGGAVAVIAGGKLNVLGESESRENYGDIRIENGGKVELGASASLQVNDFVLEASLGGAGEAASGQVTRTENMNVNGVAYFDLSLDPSGECSPGWYTFTVPFPVDALTGVSRFDNSTHLEKTIRNEVNYAIMDFSESRRVETGYGWKKYRGILQPGQCYTMTIDDVDNVYRFKKTADGAFNTAMSETLAYTEGENPVRGWNGLGNGTLAHADLSAIGIDKVQIYDHATNSYAPVGIGDYTYVVGSSFFVQTPAAGKALTYSHPEEISQPLHAPKRQSITIDEFRLSLFKEDEDGTDDVLYFSASEDATEAYVIGHDLMKFGTPTDAKVAQMWATKGGKKLCDIESTLTNNQASTPLSFFAPSASTYFVALEEAPNGADLYLTYEGNVIWNLSLSPYLIDLNKGTTEGYGLLMEAKAPQVATGTESIQSSAVSVQKIIVNGQVFILREGHMYDVTGKNIR
jgi:hypothetical protein